MRLKVENLKINLRIKNMKVNLRNILRINILNDLFVTHPNVVNHAIYLF
jgi:hypothetical protein